MTQPDRIEALLAEREARNLQILAAVLFWGALAMIGLIGLETAFGRGTPLGEIIPWLVSSTIVAAVFYELLRRRLWTSGVGLAIALMGGCFVGEYMFAFHRLFEAENLPLAVLTKMPGATMGLGAVATMSLALRPIYVVIVGSGSILALATVYLLALMDPRSQVVLSGLESILGPAVDSVRVMAEILFLVTGTVAVAFATAVARATTRDAARLQHTADEIGRYFSPNVAAGLLQGDRGVLLPGGREQDIVVLFSDLTGFTRLAAGLPAQEVLAVLSDYQERMVAAIFREGGTLDKFIGDGIMATFGTPEPLPDAADRALRAARGMMAALDQLNRERAAKGLAPLAQRIGIHAGPAIVGSIGTSQRLEFTAIGDTVNVASRIEGACKRSGQAAMVSAAVVERLCAPAMLTPLGPMQLDGQAEPIRLFAPA
ncbi:MAG: adenylate/guanylate cyclase domain-containing protein [Alphaproteobacteria bacterium]|nr:adenylate/guanylate cyclase domain-containing protein [Alphaproteobacteria bacterium]